MSRFKRAVACAAAALVTSGLGVSVGAVAPADSAMAPVPAAAAAKTTKFKNCTALNKKYKHGVKKSSGTKDVVRSNGKATKKSSKAKTSKALYSKNKNLDRDKDGIACEK